MTPLRLSILDLAPIRRGETASRDAFAASVALAQRAEALGYERVWYAEHHNIASIASSATSVLIAHVGAHTKTIRLGAGGVMLPNHAPLVIAEQFGTLAAMYPGRIDLGLGSGSRGRIRNTMYAAPGRDSSLGGRLPRGTCSSSRAYLEAEKSLVRGVDAGSGQGLSRSALHSGIVALRRQAGGGPRSAVRVRLALSPRPAPSWRRDHSRIGMSFGPPSSWRIALCDGRRERHRGGHDRGGAQLLCETSGGFGPSAFTDDGWASPEQEVTDEQADEILAAGVSLQVDHMMTYTAAGTYWRE